MRGHSFLLTARGGRPSETLAPEKLSHLPVLTITFGSARLEKNRAGSFERSPDLRCHGDLLAGFGSGNRWSLRPPGSGNYIVPRAL